MTASNKLTVSDQLDIQSLLVKYAMLMDRGDPAWADLFVADETSELSGIYPDPVRGVEQLRKVPVAAYERNRGKVYHHIHNMMIEPADGPEEAAVHAYALVSDWREGAGKLLLLAKYAMDLVRTDDGWRLRKVQVSIVK